MNRLVYLFIAIACAGLLGYAVWLQLGPQALDPCPLCILQRYAFVALGAVALIAALHGPGVVGRWVYAGLIALTGGLGVGVASRHIWLQNLPADQVPECGPGLNYMLENFPLGQTFEMVMTGSGTCATIDWSFLGLSMPWWTLIWYLVLIAVAVTHAVRGSRQSSGQTN